MTKEESTLYGADLENVSLGTSCLEHFQYLQN